MELQHTPNNKLSRRNWLHDAAITATGAVVLPSLLIGCDDHRLDPLKGALQDVPLTTDELAKAAQNLLNMDAFFADVEFFNLQYQTTVVYPLLHSSPANPPSGFNQFLLALITAIVIGMMGAVVAAAQLVPPAGQILAATVGAAIAIASLNIKTWALDGGSKPATLDAEFAFFGESQLQMRKAMSDLLIDLAYKEDNYKNLRENWKDVEFNGITYTLRHLASSTFPTKSGNSGSANPTQIEHTPYVLMRTAATEHFKRQIWNVMIAKAGKMNSSKEWSVRVSDYGDLPPYHYAQEVWYKNPAYQARYLRGNYIDYSRQTCLADCYPYFWFKEWWFTFDDRELSAGAAKELFKDDTPGHIINPNALFTRDYVFKQFHQEKPDFGRYYEIRKDQGWGGSNKDADSYGFDPDADNYVFTGGEFPQLKKK